MNFIALLKMPPVIAALVAALLLSAAASFLQRTNHQMFGATPTARALLKAERDRIQKLTTPTAEDLRR